MAQNNKELNIYQKLQNIQSRSTEVLKDNLNKFQNYNYYTEFQVLTFLKPLLKEQGLSIDFADLPSENYKVELVDKNWIVQYWKQITLTNVDKPEEKIISKIFALGSNQDISKAKGCAETYTVKYFLQKLFLVPTNDNLDPDRDQWTSKSRTEEPEEMENISPKSIPNVKPKPLLNTPDNKKDQLCSVCKKNLVYYPDSNK
ncbi:12658_t:CDS:1 [Funneliformis geosporum]|uniref:8028_t:CDS:1 n=1 Tax=Funneliformis geosporum TaxID=1117311 RepID=A0A9W4WQW3_9GLOM|nr:8028_t:CDS:1 [Funneliformis geosporum]CAI2185736.1 12658_t:CDS:1 [Funneliformis geosporum]